MKPKQKRKRQPTLKQEINAGYAAFLKKRGLAKPGTTAWIKTSAKKEAHGPNR